MQKEAKARIKINKLLEQSGWRFFDNETGRANIFLENHNGFPVVVLEAKSEDKSPLDGKEQARKYAQSQNVRFVILTNEDYLKYLDPEKVSKKDPREWERRQLRGV